MICPGLEVGLGLRLGLVSTFCFVKNKCSFSLDGGTTTWITEETTGKTYHIFYIVKCCDLTFQDFGTVNDSTTIWTTGEPFDFSTTYEPGITV